MHANRDEIEYLTFCQLQVLYLIALPASISICFPMEISESVPSSLSTFSAPIGLVIGPSMRFILRGFLPPFSAVAWSPETNPSLVISMSGLLAEGEDTGLELSLFFLLPKPNAI